MKQVKRPTRKQKELIKAKRLNPENWLVQSDNGVDLVIWNKDTKKFRTIRRDS